VKPTTITSPAHLASLLEPAIRARGVTAIAREAGVSRAALHYWLAGTGADAMRHETMRAVAEACGFRLRVRLEAK